MEAESIAYLVTNVAGMDSSAYSVPYVANWSGGDAAILRETATLVLTVGQQIAQALRLDPSGPAASEAARAAHKRRIQRPEHAIVNALAVDHAVD